MAASTALARWEAVKGLFAPDDYRYTQLYQMLARNLSDARRFKACLALFLDYQVGSLCLEKLEEAKKELVGTGEDCSLNTCDSLIEPLLLRLGYLLQGIAYDTHFDNMSDLPQLKGHVWQEGSFEAAL